MEGLFFEIMNKKLLSFLLLIAFIFGYTVYESLKLDHKLGQSKQSQSGSVIQNFPMDVKWKHLEDDRAFDVKEAFNGQNKVVVHFWATWCAPCEVEFPELVELTQLISKNKKILFLFVAVNDELAKVQKFLSNYKIGQNVILLKDDENQFKRLGTYKMPETYLFNEKGKVIKKYSGQRPWSQNFLINYFKNL